MNTEEDVINFYNDGSGAGRIAQELKISIDRVYRILRRHNIPIRSHKTKNTHQTQCDQTIFSPVLTGEAAYILGFIAADGCIIKSKQASPIVKLDIKSSDEDVLIKIKQYVNSTFEIKRYKYKTSYSRKDTPASESSRLIMRGDTLISALELLGVAERKSHTLGPMSNHLADDLMRHYVRGYFDGDGSWKGFGHNIAWSIIGTEATCLDIGKYLVQQKVVKVIPKLYKRHPYDIVVSLEYGGRIQCKRIGDWMYKNSNIHMNRKYNKFVEQLCQT